MFMVLQVPFPKVGEEVIYIEGKSSGKKRSFPYRKVRYGKIVVNGLPLTPMSDYGEKKNQNDFTNKGNLGRNASTIRHFNFYIHPASPSMDALPHVVAQVRLLIADTDLLRQFHLIYRAQQLDCKYLFSKVFLKLKTTYDTYFSAHEQSLFRCPQQTSESLFNQILL
ncbi:Hypothetical predicted protein [Mytilus galloprovincialis]|uniref:Uncharacterized protein n=1 Tax=Mytilus galloprovincialis TaxID=29158 RepID=A0A8B6FFP6_MYTGA|nr:Hypothetical predicted protein [Mytilus galloprovincialis]